MNNVMIIMLSIAFATMLVGIYLVFNNGYPSSWDAADRIGCAAQLQANALVRYILPGYALIFSGGIAMIASVIFLKK
jgi:hypothetical protein